MASSFSSISLFEPVPHFTPSCVQTTRGDLWVVFSVAFPRTLTEQQREQLQALFGGVEEWQRQEGAHGEQHEEL